ncbi:unnamed protein product, partial [marine sediment metagenome]
IDRTLVLTYAAENSAEKAFCPLIKEGLSKIGIDVEIRPMIWTSQWELMKCGPEDVQDMFVLLWWPTFNDPYDTLYSLWSTEENPFWNFAYYKNSEFDDLIDEAYATPNPEKAKELYSEAQAIIVEDAPSVYLFDVETLVPMRSKKGNNNQAKYYNQPEHSKRILQKEVQKAPLLFKSIFGKKSHP